jgi:hypothetical protein
MLLYHSECPLVARAVLAVARNATAATRVVNVARAIVPTSSGKLSGHY